MRIESERMLIGGELVTSVDGTWDESVNPTNEEPIGRAPSGGKADIDLAVAAGKDAWPAWAALPIEARADKLLQFADALNARAEELLEIEVTDTGNTITPMRGDVKVAIDSLKYFAGLGGQLGGHTVPATTDNIHMSIREPYGVVGKIVPFNHPVLFAVSRTAPALMAGNSVVVKPAETCPLSTLVLGEIVRDIFPAGVFNIVTGQGRTAGDALARHRDIKRLAFIGSVPTGLAIQRAAAEVCVKNVTLELGGKNPMIVFPDVDVEVAAQAAVAAMNFSWQGQSCGSMSRLMLHADIHDAVLKRVVEIVANLRLGDPMSADSQMGPVNSLPHLNKVNHYIEIAKQDGARLETGGKRPEGSDFKKGFWVEPTVFSQVTGNMRIAQEEVFGPILSVLKWTNIDDAIKVANSTEFGLTAAIWTNNLDNAMYTARRVRSGFQWINGASFHFLGAGFGGYGNSGIGREECLEDMLSYTELKTINIMLKNPTDSRII